MSGAGESRVSWKLECVELQYMELEEYVELEQSECIELKELELKSLKPWELELGSTINS